MIRFGLLVFLITKTKNPLQFIAFGITTFIAIRSLRLVKWISSIKWIKRPISNAHCCWVTPLHWEWVFSRCKIGSNTEWVKIIVQYTYDSSSFDLLYVNNYGLVARTRWTLFTIMGETKIMIMTSKQLFI